MAWAAGLALGLGLTVAACGGSGNDPGGGKSGEPQAKRSPSAEASATPSASAVSARKSDGGAEDAKQAAKAFVQRFLTAHDDAMASGDFSAVKAMSTKDCSNCQMAVSYFGKLYSDGGKVEGGTFTEPKVTVTEASQESAVVAVKTTVSEYKIVTAEGAGEKYPAKPSDSTFTLAKGSDGRWRVANWTYD